MTTGFARAAIGALLIFGGCDPLVTDVKHPDGVTLDSFLPDGTKALHYCLQVRSNARRLATQKEIAGWTVGALGLIGIGMGTGGAAVSQNDDHKVEWAAVGAVGGILTGIAAYLLTSAASDRTGEGLLTAAVVQMQGADPFPLGSDSSGKIIVLGQSGSASEAIEWKTCSQMILQWQSGANGPGTADGAAATLLSGVAATTVIPSFSPANACGSGSAAGSDGSCH